MMTYYINRVYRYIPFLHELNCLIDWSITDTTCDLWKYMRIEEARNLLFVGKYNVLTFFFSYEQASYYAKDSISNRSEARPFSEKIIWGFSFILLIVLLLILPPLLFSSGSLALVSNPVTSASMHVDLIVCEIKTQYSYFVIISSLPENI